MTHPLIPVPASVAVAAAWVLAGAAPQAAPSADDWASWNAFPEGAWVRLERDLRGQFKSVTTTTLIKKPADRLAVKFSGEDAGDEPAHVQVVDGPAKLDEATYEKAAK
jgi:hypothetical protein